MPPNALATKPQLTHTTDRSSHHCAACAVAGTGDWQMCPDCGTDFPPHAMLDDLRRNEYVCLSCSKSRREDAVDIFGDDAVLFITEMDEGCLPGSDEPAPGAQLFVGEWADGDFGFVAQRPDGTQITVNVPPDHARALIAALTAALAA